MKGTHLKVFEFGVRNSRLRVHIGLCAADADRPGATRFAASGLECGGFPQNKFYSVIKGVM